MAVGFLPIIERELRVAGRQNRTWWRRVVVLAIALLIFSMVEIIVGQFGTLSMIGQVTCGILAGFSLVYVLLAGPAATSDCLSRERREGTLGLLFLTDLSSFDIVLGKLGAASLDLFLGLASILPILALPILMGGFSLSQFAFVLVALVGILFLSLSVGALFSACFASSRAALGCTVAGLLILTLGLPFVGEDLLQIHAGRHPAAPWIYMWCPVYGFMMCLPGLPRGRVWEYWLNLGGMQALAWCCLALAARRTRNSWRDIPTSDSAIGRLLRRPISHWSRGTRRLRLAWRRSMLERNPVSWIEGRDFLQSRVLWALIFACILGNMLVHLRRPKLWPDRDAVVTWALFSHFALCFWIATQAPRRLADDKQSGALELLLCTPMPPRRIVSGIMRILRRRFGWGLAGLLVLDASIAYAYYSEHGGWAAFRKAEEYKLAWCALVVFPVQAYTMARIGLYEGLARANSTRATFMLVGKVGVLPWATWFVFMVTYAFWRKLGKPGPISDMLVFGSWAGAHFLVCGLFLAHDNWQLRWRFRALAARTGRVSWWKRGRSGRVP